MKPRESDVPARLRMGRFEKKILATMCIVALAPLVGALILGSSVLEDAFHAGVNDRFGAQLDQNVVIHRAYLTSLRERGEFAADAIAESGALRDALLAGDAPAPVRDCLQAELDRRPFLSALRVFRGEEELVSVTRVIDDARALSVEREVHVPSVPEQEADPEGTGDAEETGREEFAPDRSVASFRIEVTATAPLALFEDFQRAGDEAEVYRRLMQRRTYVSKVYLWVYVAFLALVIIGALGVAVVLSRRVTQRVTALAEATRRLGRGDMSVTVPSRTSDEVGELIDAFNKMVDDLRLSRERIDYLKRIGAWQEFARRLAHEIKNPLTPIQLAAQEVHRSYDGEDAVFGQKLADAKDIIEEEVDTLRRLVSEFSNFAKLPSAALAPAELGQFLTELEVGFGAIVVDVFPDGRQPLPAVRIEAEDSLPVQIDGMMLKRCVDNLVRNALQAMRKGEGTKVVIRAWQDGPLACFSVEDDGPGIDEHDRARIFDPYFTTKKDGTGLGLAIVKKVILEHEGSIVCEESSLGGARFAIHLPLR